MSIKPILNFEKNFDQRLDGQPNMFVLSSYQEQAFISTAKGNLLLVDLIGKTKVVELEEAFKISQVKACINCHGKFFIFANKMEKIKGLFLLELDEKDFDEGKFNHPDSLAKTDRFLIKWQSMLDVADVDLFCIEE